MAELRALADECVAPTLYGVGDDITGWAEAALDAVGDGQIVVVGNSVGGSCAIEVARIAPRKVEAMVLCGSKPGHRPEPALRDEALEVLAGEGLAAAWERCWLPLFGPHASPETIERGWRCASALGDGLLASGVRAFHSRPDRAAFLDAWTGPVWVVGGECETTAARDRRLAGRLSNSSFQLVGRAGHYVPLEAPDAFTAIVAEAVTAGV